MDKIMYVSFNILGFLMIFSWAMGFTIDYAIAGIMLQVLAEVRYGYLHKNEK